MHVPGAAQGTETKHVVIRLIACAWNVMTSKILNMNRIRETANPNVKVVLVTNHKSFFSNMIHLKLLMLIFKSDIRFWEVSEWSKLSNRQNRCNDRQMQICFCCFGVDLYRNIQKLGSCSRMSLGESVQFTRVRRVSYIGQRITIQCDSWPISN